MNTSEDISALQTAPQTQQEGSLQIDLALIIPRKITPDEVAADKLVMDQIGRFLVPQKESLSDYTIGVLLSIVVSRFPRHLDNRYQIPADATKLVMRNSAVRETLLDDLKKGDFTMTRRLTVLQEKTAELEAITNLHNRHRELLELLTITVAHDNQWTKNDISNNNAIMYDPHNYNTVPPSIRAFENDLARLRPPPSNENSTDFILAKSQYPNQFSLVFSEPNAINPTTALSLTDSREYLAFYVLNRSFLVDTINAKNDSSNFKTAVFCHFFVYTPLLYISTKHVFKQDQLWEFQIILYNATRNYLSKYKAKSDWFLMHLFLCPLIISEVISQGNESDENRMLLQGIAAVRVGQHFMQQGKEFFLVAIYLTADLTVRRYILMHDPLTNRVHIAQKEFHLRNSNEAHAFFLEMLNLREKVTELSDNFDKKFQTKLSEFSQVAKDLRSLHSRSRDNRTASRGHSNDNDNDNDNNRNRNRNRNQNLDPGQFRVGFVNPPPNEDDVNEDNYGVFHAYSLRNALEKLGYKMLYILFFNPNVAIVFPKRGPEITHFAKFIPHYSNELKIIKYLNSVQSPFNNVIRPIGSTTVSEGSVMVMPCVGKPFTKVDNASLHVPGLLLQLLECVQFLHDNRVAHLDLKPENILVELTQADEPPKLTIIDFSCAVKVDSQASCVDIVRGTDGYMAPEIELGPYNPFKADLWSFGVVLMRLCEECGEFLGRSVILDVAGQLTQVDPDKRPALSEILRQMRYFGHRERCFA